MNQAILSKMLDQLQLLEPEELLQLNHAIQSYLSKSEKDEQAVFHQALVKSGLVRQIKKIPAQSKVHKRIQVQGDSISKTIIEERR